MANGFIGWYSLDIATLFQFTIMMLAIATVFDIVQIVAGLLTQQAQTLGTCHMELLFTIGFIALHTGADSGAMGLAHFLANIAVWKGEKGNNYKPLLEGVLKM